MVRSTRKSMYYYGGLEERNDLLGGVCVMQGGKRLMEKRWKEEEGMRMELRQNFRKRVTSWVFDMD